MAPRRQPASAARAVLLAAATLAIVPTRAFAQGEAPPPEAAPRVTHSPIYIDPPPGAYLGDEQPRGSRRHHSHKPWRALGIVSIGLIAGGAVALLGSGVMALFSDGGSYPNPDGTRLMYTLCIGGAALVAIGVTLGIVVLTKRRQRTLHASLDSGTRGPLLAIQPTGILFEF